MNTKSPSLFSRLRRPFLAALTASSLALLPGCGSDAGTNTEPATEPAPAEVPERALEVVEYGEGETTVVFEAGFGDDWTPWKKVATEVATQARTFAYSRPGYGLSEASPDPRDAAHIVEELRAVLAARGHAPPYLLVGHSFGGAYMELFAKAHPEEVLGLVLVDSRHRDFGDACEEAALPGCVPPDSVVASLPPVEIDEFEGFALISEQIAAAGPFGSYPVRVLTATSHGFTPEVETLWESLHGSLADEATDGEQTIYEGAGHYLQLQRVHEVAEVITSLLPTTPEGH